MSRRPASLLLLLTGVLTLTVSCGTPPGGAGSHEFQCQYYCGETAHQGTTGVTASDKNAAESSCRERYQSQCGSVTCTCTGP